MDAYLENSIAKSEAPEVFYILPVKRRAVIAKNYFTEELCMGKMAERGYTPCQILINLKRNSGNKFVRFEMNNHRKLTRNVRVKVREGPVGG